MLSAWLTDSNGALIRSRVLPAVIACLILALAGSALVVVTPVFNGHDTLQGMWVLTCVFLMKIPLVTILFWLVLRNRELPTQRPDWDPSELEGIFEHLLRQADAAVSRPDARERLNYLSREAWNVADRLEGDPKVDALTVALRIDTHLAQIGEGSGAADNPRPGGDISDPGR